MCSISEQKKHTAIYKHNMYRTGTVSGALLKLHTNGNSARYPERINPNLAIAGTMLTVPCHLDLSGVSCAAGVA